MMLWIPGTNKRIDPAQINHLNKGVSESNYLLYYRVNGEDLQSMSWSKHLVDSEQRCDIAFAWLEAAAGKKGNRGDMGLIKVAGCKHDEWIDPSRIVNSYFCGQSGEYDLACQLLGGTKTTLHFHSEADRLAFASLAKESQQPTVLGGGKRMLNQLSDDLKKFLSENREIIYIVVLVLIIDQYVLDGAFRERIKGIVDNFLKRAETRAGVATIPTTATRVE